MFFNHLKLLEQFNNRNSMTDLGCFGKKKPGE